MSLLRMHSKLEIRSGTPGIESLDLPSGLPMVVHALDPTSGMDTIPAGIPPGSYRFDSYLSGYLKERGELIVDNNRYHVEVMSYYSQIRDSFMPLIVKMWDVGRSTSSLYIVKFGAAEFRGEFGSVIRNNSRHNLSPMADTLIQRIVRFLKGHIPEPMPVWAQLVLGVRDVGSPLLIPMGNQSEYSSWFSEIIYGPSLITASGSMIESFYVPFGNSQNLAVFLGTIIGDLPHITTTPYYHPGTYIESHYISRTMIIDNVKKYDALLALMKIPFDHFDISIDLINCCNVRINELDTMSSFNFPFRQETLHGMMNLACSEFLSLYFEVAYVENGVAYYDRINDFKYIIDTLHIRRTMDEFILITVRAGNVMYELVFDLILLSVMSPTVISVDPEDAYHFE